MGWSIGFDDNWQRDIGYGVPCKCDHPDCDKDIDRGLAHVCGGEPYGGEDGCGLYFCSEHLAYYRDQESGEWSRQMCERCIEAKEPFEPKPDTPEWINWKLTDESWAEWRAENPQWVSENTVEI